MMIKSEDLLIETENELIRIFDLSWVLANVLTLPLCVCVVRVLNETTGDVFNLYLSLISLSPTKE